MKLKHATGVMVLLLVLTAGCSRKTLFNETVNLPDRGWSMNQFVTFEVPAGDTAQPYDLYLMVRNTARYAWSNLWLFVETHSPTGFVLRDTLEMRLADERGKWLGRGIGDRFAVEIPYRQWVRFPQTGTYRFEIHQGMRDTLLEHITGVGFRIEKSN